MPPSRPITVLVLLVLVLLLVVATLAVLLLPFPYIPISFYPWLLPATPLPLLLPLVVAPPQQCLLRPSQAGGGSLWRRGEPGVRRRWAGGRRGAGRALDQGRSGAPKDRQFCHGDRGGGLGEGSPDSRPSRPSRRSRPCPGPGCWGAQGVLNIPERGGRDGAAAKARHTAEEVPKGVTY